MALHVSKNVSGSFSPLSGFLTRFKALVGQVDTHSPQPMHLSLSNLTPPTSAVTASIWHRSTHFKQPTHFGSSYSTMNELATASDGFDAYFRLLSIPQQHPQQQHMAETSIELVGLSTRLASSALTSSSFASSFEMCLPFPVRT